MGSQGHEVLPTLGNLLQNLAVYIFQQFPFEKLLPGMGSQGHEVLPTLGNLLQSICDFD